MSDARSTEAVWAAMSTDLRRWLRRRTVDEHEADDLLQETFLRIHRRLDTLQDGERLGAWVTTIARHVLLDHVRRRAARPERPGAVDEAASRAAASHEDAPDGDAPDGDASHGDASDGGASVGEPVDAGGPGEADPRSLAWVADAIDALPDTYREAVRLFELEGLTGAQVAERLGLSVSGAKSRVQRGRALLRDALDRCCRFDFDRRGNLLGWERRPEARPCGDCGG